MKILFTRSILDGDTDPTDVGNALGREIDDFLSYMDCWSESPDVRVSETIYDPAKVRDAAENWEDDIRHTFDGALERLGKELGTKASHDLKIAAQDMDNTWSLESNFCVIFTVKFDDPDIGFETNVISTLIPKDVMEDIKTNPENYAVAICDVEKRKEKTT